MTSSDAPLFSVVVVAGGAGRRFGGPVPKQFQPLGGIPVLIHTLRRFGASPLVGEMILVLPEARIPFFNTSILPEFPVPRLTRVVAGGETRRDSVREGLRAVDASRFPFVAIHDAVRPFFDPRWLKEGQEWLERFPAVIVGVPPTDTIKRSSGRSFVARTLPRYSLTMAQTPQMFQTRLIIEAHETAEGAGWEAPDDAALMERLGYPVKVIEGSRWNIKITEPEDLRVGEAILSGMNASPGREGRRKS